MAEGPHVEVVPPIPEGGIVWLHNIRMAGDDIFYPAGDTPAHLLIDELVRITGHTRFTVLFSRGAGEVRVCTSATEVIDELVERAKAAGVEVLKVQ